MRLEDIDPNLKNKGLSQEKYTWYPMEAATLCGCLDPTPPMHRFDRNLAYSIGPEKERLARFTSGMRLRFYTDSPYIALSACLFLTAEETALGDMTVANVSGFDLYEKDEDQFRFKGIFRPDGLSRNLCCDILRYNSEYRLVEINFPLFNGVDSLAIGLKPGSKMAQDTTPRKRFVLYGSSVTQGACSSRPGNSYGAALSRALDCDYVNLGLAGQCLGEQALARYIGSIPMDAFVMEYDHNAPTTEFLEQTHEPFFRTFRALAPNTPVLFITMPLFHCETLRSRGWWEERRTQVIRRTYENAVASGDKNVCFIDGDTLITLNRDFCTHDQVHCNDMGFFSFANTVLPVLKTALSK